MLLDQSSQPAVSQAYRFPYPTKVKALFRYLEQARDFLADGLKTHIFPPSSLFI
jgi:hypothetical protein